MCGEAKHLKIAQVEIGIPPARKFSLLAALTAFALMAACSSRARINNSVLTVAETKTLTTRHNLPTTIRFRGVVTLVNIASGFVTVQDQTGAIRVELAQEADDKWLGHQVEIAGTVGASVNLNQVTKASVQDLSAASLPKPLRVSLNRLLTGNFDNVLVAINGVARMGQVDVSGNLLIPLQVEGGGVLNVQVIDDRSETLNQITDAEISVTGVVTTGSDVNGKVTELQFSTPSRKYIKTIRPASDPEKLPLKTVAEIRALPLPSPIHRIRLRGRAKQLKNNIGNVLEDATGSIPVMDGNGLDFSGKTEQDIVAFVVHENGVLALKDATLVNLKSAVSSNHQIELRRSKDVRALTVSEALLGWPVRLHAVVTYYDPDWQMLFVQDAYGGVYVSTNGVALIKELKAGDRVIVSGVSGPGDFMPLVQQPKIQIIGHSSLPAPFHVDLESLFQGSSDSQWVEMEGVIQRIRTEDKRFIATLNKGSHQFEVQLPALEQIPSDWINAVVRVQGACATLFNSKRQILGVRLFTPNLKQFKIIKSSATSEQIQKIKQIKQLLQFSPHEEPDRRVHVRGQVESTQSAGPTWIRDNSGTVMIRDHNKINLSLGDIVDVVGFAVPGDYSAELQHASITRLSSGLPLQPITVTADTALAAAVHGQLVHIEGKLLNQLISSYEETLLLRSGKFNFTVHGASGLPIFQTGSTLSITGILLVKAKLFHSHLVPYAFDILIDSPSACKVVTPAPWFTQTRALISLCFTLFAIVAVLMWVMVLRRRVEAQTRVIGQKLTEVELLREKAEAACDAKSQFLANMSHELRTPLNGILGMAELALHASSPAEQRESIEVIRSSGDSLLAILNDLLDLSKIEAGKLELYLAPFSLRQLITETAQTFAFRMQEKELRFTTEFAENLPDSFVGDVLRLRQILLNLVGNAIKFTAAGFITVCARSEQQDADTVTLWLSVQDSGIGIAKDKQKRIFESFRQADNSIARTFGGTGLGLSICHKLTSLMHGTISVESEPGIGSTFTIRVPLKLAAEPVITAAPPSQTSQQGLLTGPLRILLAEDNHVNQTLAVRLLSKQGHNVTVADNGKLAVDAFKNSDYDLILMDVQMPEMDGIEATAAIRSLELALNAHIPIVAMTAQTMQGDREKCLAVGMDAFVSKPIRWPELYSTIESLCCPAAKS